jgi:hypothetical protein
MVYDPIKKREYDRIRNARLKAEYLEKNPNYKPTRKSKYDIEPIKQSFGIGGGFHNENQVYNIYAKQKQQVKYNNGLEKDSKKKISLNLDDEDDADYDYYDEPNILRKTKYVNHAVIGNRRLPIKFI